MVDYPSIPSLTFDFFIEVVEQQTSSVVVQPDDTVETVDTADTVEEAGEIETGEDYDGDIQVFGSGE